MPALPENMTMLAALEMSLQLRKQGTSSRQRDEDPACHGAI